MTIILSFVASFLATIAYYFAEQKKESAEATGWIKIGRFSYIIHGVSLFTTIACIFYVMYFRMYEYEYARLHVSNDLEMKYILSAFWEGQEGSFLLWMFWHVVLGFILIRVAKNWEAPVMSILSLCRFINWKRPKSSTSKLLDDHSSTYFVFRVCINYNSILLRNSGLMEWKTSRDAKSIFSVGPIFWSYFRNWNFDGWSLGL